MIANARVVLRAGVHGLIVSSGSSKMGVLGVEGPVWVVVTVVVVVVVVVDVVVVFTPSPADGVV